MKQSLWRGMLYKALSSISISGETLDLGGPREAAYHDLFQGAYTITCTDFDPEKETDLSFNFENPFPVESSKFDSLLCINVLEHIFNYQNVLSESYRILKDGGMIVLAVPFLIRVHPSPNDYWRYTDEALLRIFKEAGFKNIDIQPIGTGVFGASYSLRHNLYRVWPVQEAFKMCARGADMLLSSFGSRTSFTKKSYPLGYLVVAQK